MTRLNNLFYALAVLFALFAASPLGALGQSTGSIAGQVVDATTDDPLPGVNVVMPEHDRGAATDADGRFTISGVPAGTVQLEARFVGYAPATRTVEVTAGATSRLKISLRPEAVDLTGIEVTALRPDLQPTGELQSEQIRKAEVADPGALLRDLPGIGSVRRGPVGLDPNVRGLAETEVGVYVDGMRAFPAGPARMDSPMSHIDPSTIANIDVVKGPYALTWGPGNMSAIQVEQRGEDPPRTPLTGTVRTGYDTNRQAKEATGFAMGRQGSWFYSVNGAWRSGSDYTTGNGETIPADFASAEGRGRVGVELSERSTLSAKGGYQDQRDMDYPGRLLNARFFKTGMGQVTYEFASETGRLQSLTVRASAQQTLHEMTNRGKPTYEAGTLPNGNPRPPLRIGVASEIQNFSGRAAADLTLGDAWDVTVGGDVLHTFRDARRPLEAVMDDGSRVVPPFYRANGDTLDRAWPGVTTTQEGMFVQASHSIVDGVQLTGTTRLDLAHADANDPTEPFLEHAGVTADELAQTDVMGSGALTASIVLTDQWTLSLGAGSVARPPDALERYADRFPASKSQTSAEFQGTPPLDPERSTQADVWLEGGGAGWAVSINGFARRMDDYITLAPTEIDPILPLSPPTVYRYVNGEATFVGSEVSATMALPGPWTGQASGSYLWGRDETLDEPAFGVSPPTATIGLQWAPTLDVRSVGELYVDGSVNLTAGQDRVATTRGEEATDGYATVDLRAGVDAFRRTTLEVGVENLFDATYVNHLNAKNPFTGMQLPEPGRVLFVNLSVSL